VLVIPEDFRKDQYVLQPVIAKMLAEAGKPRANVVVCVEPLMGGVDRATSWDAIEKVIDTYPTVDIFLLIVDRDGQEGRRAALDRIETLAAGKLGSDRVLFAENIWQEVEVCALAGLNKLPKDWSWAAVRQEVHPKEIYFDPYVRSRGLESEAGGGRRTLGREAAKNYKRVRSRCKEDVQALERRIGDWIKR
jgi:hypothetical protein